MTLPHELQQAIDQARQAMLNNHEHALSPARRRSIYSALSSDTRHGGSSVRSWLAILTARRVTAIWERARPNDQMPAILLEMAEKVWRQTEDPQRAEDNARQAWEKFESLGRELIGPPFLAGHAAVQALLEVVGRDPFEKVTITELSSDRDLDPWCSDTALWAAAASSGKVGDPQSDLVKRRDFWEWWLTEAIPLSWQVASKTP